ncbi:MAG: DUF3482 domain-containing protein [Pseudomonadota bacterium]
MTDAADSALSLEGARARRVLLVRAIEEVDTKGQLVSAVEREQIERAALQAVTEGPSVFGATGVAATRAPDAARFLDERARRVLEVVARRDPATATLQHAEAWQRRLAWVLPLLALFLGVALDRIDNPRQVNMLSPPLLAFIGWNLCIYLALLVQALRGWRRGPGQGTSRGLAWLDWLSQPRGRGVPAAVAARFHAQWWRVAGALEGLRLKQVLHASAAAWAVGVGLSIVVGGLVREYRVGWESTLLDLPQVHAVLRTLFAPVVALLPIDGFSQDDLARMHFASGAQVGQGEARHWIALYLGLLALMVVIPRCALAVGAKLRRAWRGRAVTLPADDPYFTEVLARVQPARVQLAWMAADATLRALMLRLWGEACAHASETPAAPGAPWRLLRSDKDDELSVLEWVPAVSAATAAAAAAPAAAASPSGALRPLGHWLARLWRPHASAQGQGADAPAPPGDLLLLALDTAAQLESLQPILRTASGPVLLLVGPGAPERGAAIRTTAAALHLDFELLDLSAHAGCWAWEAPLHQALTRRLAPHQASGMGRLLRTWQARHEARLQEAMTLLAAPLWQAAGEVEDVADGPLSLRRLVSSGERGASQHARQLAMTTLLLRLADTQERALAQLRRLHGVSEGPLGGVQPGVDLRFTVREAVNAPQAGMAGAASGAAAGATIDLMTGGLTLGAAAALGALVGGGAGWVAAAWKNRSAPNGAPQLQLSDDMLQALCEMALLQYLGVAMRGHDMASPVPADWRSEVVTAVEARRNTLQGIWAAARRAGYDAGRSSARVDAQEPPQGPQAELAGLLAAMAREVIARLRPAPVGE